MRMPVFFLLLCVILCGCGDTKQVGDTKRVSDTDAEVDEPNVLEEIRDIKPSVLVELHETLLRGRKHEGIRFVPMFDVMDGQIGGDKALGDMVCAVLDSAGMRSQLDIKYDCDNHFCIRITAEPLGDKYCLVGTACLTTRVEMNYPLSNRRRKAFANIWSRYPIIAVVGEKSLRSEVEKIVLALANDFVHDWTNDNASQTSHEQ